MQLKRATHTLMGFEPSTRRGKKYMALVKPRGKDGPIKRVHFGSIGYQQYRDTTGIGVYSHLDHLDESRRRSYRARHRVYLTPDEFTPAYFSWHYLW
jgi:hypothetical protein